MKLGTLILQTLEKHRLNSKDNVELIAKTTFEIGQEKFESFGVSEMSDAVNIVAGCLYEKAPHLDHDMAQ